MSDGKYSGDKVLDIMSANARNRNNAIEKLIRKYIFDELSPNARVAEFGAGKGEFIFRFMNIPGIELSAIEVDKGYAAILSEKIKVYSSLNEIEGELDGIFLIDVLEHIEDDMQILKQLYDKLKKNGRLFIYVPARMELYSAFDKSIGHYRRYSKKKLRKIVTGAGFTISTVQYHDLFGYFASAANKMFSSNGQLNPRAVKIYDTLFFPVSSFVELFMAPIGKSIFLYASKE